MDRFRRCTDYSGQRSQISKEKQNSLHSMLMAGCGLGPLSYESLNQTQIRFFSFLSATSVWTATWPVSGFIHIILHREESQTSKTSMATSSDVTDRITIWVTHLFLVKFGGLYPFLSFNYLHLLSPEPVQWRTSFTIYTNIHTTYCTEEKWLHCLHGGRLVTLASVPLYWILMSS